METAYFMKTGKQLLLSEQNLLDCAWDYGNTGCLGGFQPLAFNYMHDVREIASEEVRDISMRHQDDRPQKLSLLQAKYAFNHMHDVLGDSLRGGCCTMPLHFKLHACRSGAMHMRHMTFARYALQCCGPQQCSVASDSSALSCAVLSL